MIAPYAFKVLAHIDSNNGQKRSQIAVIPYTADKGMDMAAWAVLPCALEEPPRFQGGPSELRGVTRTVERVVEMDALGILALGNTEVQARLFLQLLKGSLPILHLVHPFTSALLRRSMAGGSMSTLLTASGLESLRKAAAPLAALYYGIYSSETGARVGPADAKAAKPHPAWSDLGKRLAAHVSLAKVDEDTIKKVLAATGGSIDKTATPLQIRAKREAVPKEMRSLAAPDINETDIISDISLADDATKEIAVPDAAAAKSRVKRFDLSKVMPTKQQGMLGMVGGALGLGKKTVDVSDDEIMEMITGSFAAVQGAQAMLDSGDLEYMELADSFFAGAKASFTSGVEEAALPEFKKVVIDSFVSAVQSTHAKHEAREKLREERARAEEDARKAAAEAAAEQAKRGAAIIAQWRALPPESRAGDALTERLTAASLTLTDVQQELNDDEVETLGIDQ